MRQIVLAAIAASVPVTSRPPGRPISTMPVMRISLRPLSASSSRQSCIAPPQQRHVGRMLEIAEPDDPGLAVRGAVAMAGHEALDTGDAKATARKLPQRGRSRSRRAPPRPRRIAPSAESDCEQGEPCLVCSQSRAQGPPAFKDGAYPMLVAPDRSLRALSIPLGALAQGDSGLRQAGEERRHAANPGHPYRLPGAARRSGARRRGRTSSCIRPKARPARRNRWPRGSRRTRPGAASRSGWKPTARSIGRCRKPSSPPMATAPIATTTSTSTIRQTYRQGHTDQFDRRRIQRQRAGCDESR